MRKKHKSVRKKRNTKKNNIKKKRNTKKSGGGNEERLMRENERIKKQNTSLIKQNETLTKNEILLKKQINKQIDDLDIEKSKYKKQYKEHNECLAGILKQLDNPLLSELLKKSKSKSLLDDLLEDPINLDNPENMSLLEELREANQDV
jgi:hypothetical protein